MELAERVQAEIDRTQDELVAWLRRLVGFPSLVGQEGPAQAFVAETLRAFGDELDVWDVDAAAGSVHGRRPNVVGRWRGSGGGRSLLLNGHVDVVPIEDLRLWRVDPWSGAVIDGRMYGRGTSDMKAGLAAMVWAYRVLRATTRLRGDLILESVIEEEAGGAGTRAAVARGYTADGAVVGEPTSMDLVPGHQGLFWFRISVPGLSAHAGYRTRGVNAIEKAMLIYDALRGLETERNRSLRSPLFEHVDIPAPISVGKLHAGEWPATVPDRAVLEGRVGVRVGETLQEAKAEFEAAVAAAADRDGFLAEHRPAVEYLGPGSAPAQIALDHPLAELAGGLLGRLKPGFRTWIKTPSTDMHHLVDAGHTPTLIVGPGDDELAHAANESCAIAHLTAAATFYALLALEWCG